MRQLAGLLKLRLKAGSKQEIKISIKILVRSRTIKGIDHALLPLNGAHPNICELSIPEWLASLDEKCRETVRNVWEEV